MSAPTLAAVDIGTNSVKMTIGRGDAILFDGARVTRLGQGVDAAGVLAPDAMERTLAALEAFAAHARAHGVTRLAAVGTSALRDASNGPEFAQAAARVLGGPVEIITGDREAHLVYLAARRDPELAVPDGALLVATDVGGGSTEVVVGDTHRILSRHSLQIGAVRLAESAGLNGVSPIDSLDIMEAVAQMDKALAPVLIPDAPCVLVASGGTAANLAGMEQGALDPQRIHAVTLPVERIWERVHSLAALSLEARKQVPGLEPARADVIVAGALIQWGCAQHFGCTSIRISARGLRYGLLYAMRDEE